MKPNYYDSEDYIQMLFSIVNSCEDNKPRILVWENGFKVKCFPVLGVEETSLEPDDENYDGQFYTSVEIIEILENSSNSFLDLYDEKYIEILKLFPDDFYKDEHGKVDLYEIYNIQNKKYFMINIYSIPEKVMFEDGTVLWSKS
ncbi:MAG: hypothetical protein FWF50_04225 [Defluviitaleaceae bacterium]|nr:hypothetical protein [Defluviitaleaceae bacterium]